MDLLVKDWSPTVCPCLAMSFDRVEQSDVRVLAVNAGSTGIKVRMVESDGRISSSADLAAPGSDSVTDVSAILASAGPLDAIGHRLVHGGPYFDRPVLVDEQVRVALEGLNELAPLHNPPSLRMLDTLRRLAPEIPSVACFDTAFHARLPRVAQLYALPTEWTERWGIRRYGFHGLSCEWAVSRRAEMVGGPAERGRVVVCHLGGGASVTAVCEGRSVDTTMGFTPTEGLVMATRSGDVDPGSLAWLAARGIGPEAMADALERRSGLLALSGGRSGDMRELLRLRGGGDERAGTAIGVYLHRLRGKIASAAAAMGGLEALVFTGGVGENAPDIRLEACQDLRFMGVTVDPASNRAVGDQDRDVTAPAGRVQVLVIHSREELVIAGHCRQLLSAGSC